MSPYTNHQNRLRHPTRYELLRMAMREAQALTGKAREAALREIAERYAG